MIINLIDTKQQQFFTIHYPIMVKVKEKTGKFKFVVNY